MISHPSLTEHDLSHFVQTRRTGRRIRNLVIEVRPERIVLRGSTDTFYVKQLAQHVVRELMPDARLENAITVDPVS